jgi:hypothetical protein
MASIHSRFRPAHLAKLRMLAEPLAVIRGEELHKLIIQPKKLHLCLRKTECYGE